METKHSSSKHSSKSYKVIRIKRKIDKNPQILSVDEDLALEKDKDPSKFLSLPESMSLISPIYNENGDLLPRNVIGPLSSFSSKSPTEAEPIKRVISLRSPTKRWTMVNQVDFVSKFEEALFKIEETRKKAEKEEKSKVLKMSPRQQVIANRQSRILQNYKKAQRYWQNIERGLALKSKKFDKKLVTTMSSEYLKTETTESTSKGPGTFFQDNLMWYMSLRDCENEKLETYLRVGSELGGLHMRVKGRPLDYRSLSPVMNFQSLDAGDLQVLGVKKLPLEVEAVKRVGLQYLKPELIDTNIYDEVIAEHYDSKFETKNI